MGASTNVAPVIIKRKKVIAAAGHHGGAWKVAYADFVTAMMAFFMLMWLLNATTENQRKGLADYFSPTVPLSRVSGGGDGAFGGDSVFSELDLPDNGTGASQRWPTQARQAKGASGTDTTAPDKAVDPKLIQAELDLFGQTGDSMVAPELMRHIVTRVTDEGLLIEIFATQDKQLFSPDIADPTPLMRDIAVLISRVARTVTNDVALGGYVQARPVVVRLNPVWDLSLRRADRMRQMLETEGLDPRRMRRVTGHADRKPAVHDPMATRNDRIEVILLRN